MNSNLTVRGKALTLAIAGIVAASMLMFGFGGTAHAMTTTNNNWGGGGGNWDHDGNWGNNNWNHGGNWGHGNWGGGWNNNNLLWLLLLSRGGYGYGYPYYPYYPYYYGGYGGGVYL